jgi:FAD:protein FMN transferase
MCHRWFCGFMLVCGIHLHGSQESSPRKFDYSADAMGGAFSITVYSVDKAGADAAADAAFAELARLDGMLSNFRPESEWSRLNSEAARHDVRVSDELFALLLACAEYTRGSDAAFDISVGPLIRAWGFRDGHGKPASDQEVKAALGLVGFDKVRLDHTGRTVRFLRPGMELDPGGIGKGYAVDRMTAVLKMHGIDRALVSAAGSSIFGLGAPPDRAGWVVRIEDPKTRNAVSTEILLKDEAISISGSREKSFRTDGRVYGHILDPRTGYPVASALLVAVSAPRAVDTEAWTKAVFVNGRSWAAAHKREGYRVFFCGEHDRCGWLSP